MTEAVGSTKEPLSNVLEAWSAQWGNQMPSGSPGLPLCGVVLQDTNCPRLENLHVYEEDTKYVRLWRWKPG